jgi:hypothetical protein
LGYFMLERGRENVDWSGYYFRCGDPVTVLMKTGAFWTTSDCERWGCDDCRKKKILFYQRKFREMFPGAVVSVAEVPMREKALSRFISRKVAKPYFAVHLSDRAMAVTVKGFEGSRPRNKKKFVERDLPELLDTIRRGRAVSLSRKEEIMDTNQDEPVNQFYGRIPGDRVKEWERLSSDKERADWLRSQPEIRLFKAGIKLLEENP